jgi:hypothetical protein
MMSDLVYNYLLSLLLKRKSRRETEESAFATVKPLDEVGLMNLIKVLINQDPD